MNAAGRNLQEPPTTLGMLTIRMSCPRCPTQAESVDELNLIVVGGKFMRFQDGDERLNRSQKTFLSRKRR